MSDKIFVPGLSNLPPLDPKRDLSKTFLHVNRKMVCIYDYYLEQAAVFDVGLLKQRKRSTKSKSGLLKKQKRPTKRKPPLPPLPWLRDPRLVPCVIFTDDYLNDHSKMPPAPRWHDYEAMAKWVKLRPVMLLLHVEMRPKTEREAISEARAGDCRALLAMGENGFQLSREAWAALRGNLEGKIKKPDQRPTQPPFGSALRSILPIAELAYEEIYALLRGHPKYSGRSHREIKDRALQVAAAEYGLEVETLAYYIERSSKSRSRHNAAMALESSLRA